MIPVRLQRRSRNVPEPAEQGRAALARRVPAGRSSRLASAGLVGLLAMTAGGAGVLNPSDLQKVQNLRPMFQNLVGDLVQTSRRTDIASADAECIRSTIQELLQMSQELSSYEYLITIEKDLNEAGDNAPVREVVKFAIDKSNSILTGERKRLTQLSEQCARLPLSYGKAQEALQFIDVTTGILGSIQTNL